MSVKFTNFQPRNRRLRGILAAAAARRARGLAGATEGVDEARLSPNSGVAARDPFDGDAYFIRGMARLKLAEDSDSAEALALADLQRAAQLKPSLAPFVDDVRKRLIGGKVGAR